MQPPNPRRSALQLVRLLLITALLCFTGITQAVPPPTEPLVRVHYDLEVAIYCSFVTTAVASGFKHQLAHIVEMEHFSPEQVTQAQRAATTAAYNEWQNRGLGGFRGWCRKEGAASVRRFSINVEE